MDIDGRVEKYCKEAREVCDRICQPVKTLGYYDTMFVESVGIDWGYAVEHDISWRPICQRENII